MVRFSKFFDFSALHFLNDYENDWSHMNFSCLKFWDTLLWMTEDAPDYRLKGSEVQMDPKWATKGKRLYLLNRLSYRPLPYIFVNGRGSQKVVETCL